MADEETTTEKTETNTTQTITEGADGGGGEAGKTAQGLAAQALAAGAGKEEEAKEEGMKPGEDAKASERPEWVPEQFWDGTKGEIKSEALTKSWKDQQDHIRDLNAKAKQKPPEAPEEYEFAMPEGLPEGFEIAKDDPAMKLFKQVAHDAGLSQEQFSKVAGQFMVGATQMVPPEALIDVKAEKAKLGENADQLIAGVVNWGETLKKQGVWSDEEYEEIVLMNSTAPGIMAMSKLRAHYENRPIPARGAQAAGLMSKEELYQAVGSEKYAKDATYRKEIDQQFAKVFGTEPTGTSEAGIGMSGLNRHVG